MTSATKLFAVCVATALLFGVGSVFAPTASAQYPDPGRDPVQDKTPDNALPRSLEQTDPEPFRRGGIRSVVSPAAAKSADPLVPSAGALFTRSGADLPDVRFSSSSIADVDGQNGPDLLITGRDSNGDRVATLYLQQPDGSFQPASAGLSGVRFGSSSIADVDGQNGLDLFIIGRDSNGNATTTLYLQQPDGSFQPANADLSGVAFGSSSIADIDGQNGLDLLITGRDSNRDPVATLYLQQPDGSFQPASAGLTGVDLSSSSIADVDGQNGLDLLITGRDSNRDPVATLYLQQPDGSFQPASAGLEGVTFSSSSIADVDAQNGPDLLITGRDSNFDLVATLYLQQPDGSFQPAGAGLAGVYSSSSSIADVDGQNGPDLLITGDDSNLNPTATLYLQQPDGSFQPASAGLTGVNRGSSSIADIDTDGDLDLLLTGSDGFFGEPSARVYVNRTVQPGPNRPPRVAQPVTPQILAAGTELRLRVEFGDPDGDRLALQLTQGPRAPGTFRSPTRAMAPGNFHLSQTKVRQAKRSSLP